MAQFFTGMVSDWSVCAKLAGMEAAARTNVALYDSTDLRFKYAERKYPERTDGVPFS